ncbi:hypothetical protein [Stygiolobus caldivivus]|uniref:KEOPS complex Pcc1-like subunit n=1 Tax=Stygiolobus caldivivus TaxID=2824673 RepID=A0A8D5U8B2_9CREN|nr:hypothetical protein [Stygiolobus caldivivus]BCU70626.1 KEOPS complex Pcc1-like subunit [Stygiolobus caldivivus]
MKVQIEIKIDEVDGELKKVIFNSILIEQLDQKIVKIDRNNASLLIVANSLSRGRAIMNSYISWIYTIIETLNKVKNNDRKNSPGVKS